MRELNAISNSMKMAPENVDKTKHANKVTFFRSEKNSENPSDRFSKRTETPSLRKTQSLLVLRTKDVGMSSSSSSSSSSVLTSHKTKDAYSDDVISITSSVSTSSSSDGRGRSIRRRLPPLPRHEPGTAVAPREGRRHRQQQQQQQRCTETDRIGTGAGLLLPVEREAKTDRRMAGGGICRPRANQEEKCSVGRGVGGLLRPVPVRPHFDQSSRLSIAPDEDPAVGRTTFQETASKRHLVSKTTPKEILDKNRDKRDSYSLRIPFFLPLNHRISSVDSEDDEDDEEEAAGEVNSLRREDHFSSGNAPKSNARKAALGKAPHPVQNYLETTCLTWPKTQDVSTEKQHSESSVTSEEDDGDVTRMSSKDKLVLRLSKTEELESGDQNVSNGSREHSHVHEWEENRVFQSSSFPIPPPPSLSLHLLLQNYLTIPVTLFGSHPGDDLGVTFAKKPLLWRHFTETLGGAFRPVATNENGSPLLGAVMVTHVAKGTSAEANGLTVGDIVVELNGTSVLRSSADDVRRLLTSSGRRVDLVLARSRSSLDPMAEPSLYRWEENSGEVHHSTTSKVRPQLTDNFHRKEFPAKHPQRFDKDDESTTKQQRYPTRKQMNRERLAEDDSRSMIGLHALPLSSSSMGDNAPGEQPHIRHPMDDDYPQNELFDPDYGWQKISAV